MKAPMSAKKKISKKSILPGTVTHNNRTPTYSLAKEKLEKAVERTEQAHGRNAKSETAVEVIDDVYGSRETR